MAPNLRDRLGIGGVIFHCNKETQAECINHKLFGAPGSHWEHVQHIRKGMPLLLWNMRTRQLIGKFVAASDGAYEIDPAAWTSATGGHKTHFPAQVRVAIVEKCVPLKDAEFKYIIEDSMEGRGSHRFSRRSKSTPSTPSSTRRWARPHHIRMAAPCAPHGNSNTTHSRSSSNSCRGDQMRGRQALLP